jgi:hypothetical protein
MRLLSLQWFSGNVARMGVLSSTNPGQDQNQVPCGLQFILPAHLFQRELHCLYPERVAQQGKGHNPPVILPEGAAS